VTSTSATRPRCGAAIALVLLLLSEAVSAHARQITSEIVEALIVHLDQKDAEGRARADSIWGVHDLDPPPYPDDTVYVVNRASLERIAGMSLEDVEDLMRALHRRGVAARWCQGSCPTRSGDQSMSIKWALPVGPDRLVVEAEVFGYHRREESDPTDLSGWMHRGSFHLVKEGERWRATNFWVTYRADFR
jgi:hypothetical protein